ncbi:DUF1850 domain-containing protein [Natroniella acetigena]|uniref:DUF1850 domain-containing protein n=1 Tax=Natroniella acetigena TaxID=52004 RepID=UPI00200B0544|nr:DUF1850 domain-containing protein [Natroniella acetigena]MCK8828385.1 DUF1850 domain-containing protein [Natroniella acetigena]
MSGYYFMGLFSKKSIVILLAIIILFSLFLLEDELLVIKDGAGNIRWEVVSHDGFEFAIGYLHSVAGTPVWEFFQVEDGQLYLVATEYQSYGAGLPFSDKNNHSIQDDKFKIEEIDQRLDSISLLIGNETEHKFLIENEEYELYKIVEPTKRVKIDLITDKKIRVWKREVLRWMTSQLM